MAVHLYGLVRSPAPLPEVLGQGVGGAAVSAVTHRRLAALVSEVDDPADDGEPSARQLRRDLAAHGDVLNRVVERTDVLPFRFGVVLPDDEAVVRDLLRPRHDLFEAHLGRIGGAVEVTLKAAYEEEAVLTEILREEPELTRRPGGRRGGMLADDRIAVGEAVAAAVRARKERDAESILDRLGPFAREIAPKASAVDMMVLQASLLVERDRLAEFDAALNELNAEAGGRMRFSCLGPLPPYSFAAMELDEGTET